MSTKIAHPPQHRLALWLAAAAAAHLGTSVTRADPTVLYRVNAGGPQLAAADGSLPAWSVDTVDSPSPYVNAAATGNTTGGTTVAPVLGPLIPPAVPPALFQTERWDDLAPAELHWSFPIAPGTEVLVRLYFSEIWSGITGPGQRTFDVAIAGDPLISGLDPFAEAGHDGAIVKWFIVTVGPGGFLELDFTHRVQNPAIKGIEILAGDGLLEAAMAAASTRAQLQLAINPPAYPIHTSPAGAWVTTPASNWTSGFFPGALWRCYASARGSSWRSAAELWTAGLDEQQYLTEHQDIGFMIYCSYGEAFRLTSHPADRDVLITAAESLAQRFNPTVGCIRASGNKDATTGEYRVIIDGMMTLELLLRAARLADHPAWRDMAISHAQRSADTLVRSDGSSFQEAFFDTATGQFVRNGTFNGYAVNSTWSRGQAWGIHGFATLYRETGDSEFLEVAQHMADYFIAQSPPGRLPPWDFNAPGTDVPRDSSAAAIAAAGLLEISRRAPDPLDRAYYAAAADDILKPLCTDACLSNGILSAGTLLHGTYNRNFNQAVDASLIWGDYYLLQALARRTRYLGPHGDCLTSLPTWQHDDLAVQPGLGILRCSVRPGDNSIDALLATGRGAADTAAGYAAVVRFAPTGAISARNGDTFSADALVTYTAGERHVVDLLVDFAAHTYSVTVTTADGIRRRVATDYAFPASQSTLATLDTWATIATLGSHEVCDARWIPLGTSDTDNDGDVDLRDAARLQTCIGRSPAADPACAPLDLDGSGAVDAVDWLDVQRCLAGPAAGFTCGS